MKIRGIRAARGRAAIAMAAMALAVPLTLLATASPASASVGGCTTDPLPDNSSVTVYTCAYISGSGRHVNWMDMHICVYGLDGSWVRMGIWEPGDQGPYGFSHIWYRSHGNCTPEFYGPTGTVSAGRWTFYAYDYNSISQGGGDTIGYVTLTIRS